MAAHHRPGRHRKKLLPLSMKLRMLYDIGMFIVFMTIYSVFNPFIATYALLGMATLKMFIALSVKEPPKRLDWVEFALLTAFCIATLVFHSAIFLKIKAPLLSVLFAGGMILYSLNTKESFMKSLFAKDFGLPHMPESVWKKIDYMVIINLLIKAAIVSTIIFNFSDTVWYYSNFVLPLFDLTMLASIYVVSHPYFKKEEERLDREDLKAIVEPLELKHETKFSDSIHFSSVLMLSASFGLVCDTEPPPPSSPPKNKVNQPSL